MTALSQETLAQFAQFQEFLASQEASETVAQPKPASARVKRERTKAAVAKNGAKSPKVVAKKKPAPKKRTCNITAGEAWKALGGDPEFQPANLDKSASGPMLWRLNDQGLLADLLLA